MTPGDRPRGSLGTFAAEVVGLNPAGNEGERTAALLRKLRVDDFLPDPLTHEALLVLAGRSIESGSLLGEEAVASEERRLHAEVERLASEFFEVPVASRVERWRTLAESCARHPRLLDRLRSLKPGLGIDRDAINDPSPAVKRLLDDLLTLFPLRTEPRAVESRARLERLRSDPSLTPRDLDRASKRVLARHPDVAALSHGFLAQLGQRRRPTKAVRARAQVLSTLHKHRDVHPTFYLFLVLSLVGGLARLGNMSKTTNPTFPVPPIRSLTPNFGPTNIPMPKAKPAPFIGHVAQINELKGKVASELARIGKAIDEDRLREAVAKVPFDELPPGMALSALDGLWNEDTRARFVGRLKEGLKAAELDLSEEDLDNVARKSLPEPAKRSASNLIESP